jgi:ABC-type nitrate/sulfonate/bicarbonate transport system permease component
LEIAVPIVILILWGALTWKGDSFVFPSLIDILRKFREIWIFARVESDVIPSLCRLALGYTIAMVLAVAIGIPLGLFDVARRAAAPIIEFFRAIPSPALIPFAIAIIGVGWTMKIFVIAFVCVWPALLNTIDGIRSIEPTMIDTAKMYRIKGWRKLYFIVLPGALPQIFAGMRTSLSLALILMVISEMVASTEGIGFFVLQSQRSFAIADMWSGILLLGLLGYGLNFGFVLAERYFLAWYYGSRGSELG